MEDAGQGLNFIKMILTDRFCLTADSLLGIQREREWRDISKLSAVSVGTHEIRKNSKREGGYDK